MYVRPFPDVTTGGERKISDVGGHGPLWGPDGRELFYLNPPDVMVVEVETEDVFTRGTPRRLFSLDPYVPGNTNWDISPDGQRFLMIKETDEVAANEIIVVQHWFEELKARVPVD